MKKYGKAAFLLISLRSAIITIFMEFIFSGSSGAVEIKTVKAVQENGTIKIEIMLDKSVSYKYFPLENPPRIIINLFEVKTDEKQISVDVPEIKSMKVSQFSTRPKLIAQIAAELAASPQDIKASQSGTSISVSFAVKQAVEEAVVEVEAAPAEAVEVEPQVPEAENPPVEITEQPKENMAVEPAAVVTQAVASAESVPAEVQNAAAAATAEVTPVATVAEAEPKEVVPPVAVAETPQIEVKKEEVPAEKVQEVPPVVEAVAPVEAAQVLPLETKGSAVTGEDISVKFPYIPLKKGESMLRGLLVSETAEGVTVRINLSNPVSYKNFTLNNPPRLVIDLSGTVVSEKRTVQVNRQMLREIRAAQYEGRPNPETRIVFELTKIPQKVNVTKENSSIIVSLSDTAYTTYKKTEEPAGSVRAEAAPAEEKKVPDAGKQEAAGQLKAEEGTIPEAAPQVVPAVPKKEAVSLDFREAEIGDIIRILAKKAKINIIGTEEVKGKVTIHLDDVDPKDALDIILKLYGYDYEKQAENIFRIVKIEAKGKTGEITKDEKVYVTKSFVIKYAKAAQISTTISKMLSKDGMIQADEPSNTLILIDAPDNIEVISRMIEELDLAPKQVSIEVKFAEVSNSSGEDINTIWNRIGKSGSPVTGKIMFTPEKGTGVGITISTADLEAVINVFRSKTDFNILSQPQIVCLDNQQASIQVGSKVPYKQISTTTGAGGSITSSEQIVYLDVGVLLNVTPHISGASSVILELDPQISTYEYGADVPGVPIINTRQLKSRVLINDGQTLIVGGLIRDEIRSSEYKVPLLGDIPLLGALFRYTSKSKTKVNLVIFITPYIVK